MSFQENPFASKDTEARQTERAPIEETKHSVSYLGVTLEKAKNSEGGFVPERDKLESFFVNDEFALELQKKIAVAMKLGQNLLVEGGTAIGKTTTVAKMCAELGYELHYVNLNGQTDVENLMGRYIPNLNRKEETDPEYAFADGSVTSGLRKEEGKIKVIVLDEVNATNPGTLKRLNEVLNAVEQGGTVVLTEDAAERIRVSKETTKVIALMNPSGQGYLGVNPLSKELINRFVYQKEANELPRKSFHFRRMATLGVGPRAQEMGSERYSQTLQTRLTMEQYMEIPGIMNIEAMYEEFHFGAKELLKARQIAEDQTQLFLYDDQRESDRVTEYVRRFYNGDISETFQRALRFYYADKLENEIDRQKLEELIRSVEYKPEPVGSKRKGLERESKTEKPEPAGEAEEGFAGKKADLEARARKLKRELLGESPAFSPEHLKALDSIFGKGNLDEAEIPNPAELTPAYFDKMYPKERRPEDEKKGLVSFRPSWWDQNAEASIVGPKPETWGEVYVRSMKLEAEELFGSSQTILSESIQKPNCTDGNQQYGSIEGTEAGKDWLIPIMEKCFGKGATRFGHSHDELTVTFGTEKEKEKFVAERKKEFGSYSFKRESLESPLTFAQRLIEESFAAKGLTAPNVRVILEPALVFNRQTTEKHPKNSRTNAWERSSTILRTQDSRDSGRRLDVGGSGYGGAGGVGRDHRDDHNDGRGFRLAVVLEK